jgi:serine/threonine-protein kinase SRPK3
MKLRQKSIHTALTSKSDTPSTWDLIPSDKETEEESVPGYHVDAFYPVKIGELFKSKYLVIAKLGFGTSSTVWLCKHVE